MRHRIDLNTSASPMRHALQGLRGSGLETDYQGTQVVAAWRYLPELRWGWWSRWMRTRHRAPLYHQREVLLETLLAADAAHRPYRALLGARDGELSSKNFAHTAGQIDPGGFVQAKWTSPQDEVPCWRAASMQCRNLQGLYQSHGKIASERAAPQLNGIRPTNYCRKVVERHALRADAEGLSNKRHCVVPQGFDVQFVECDGTGAAGMGSLSIQAPRLSDDSLVGT